MESISAAAAYTLKFINQTHRSVFLTGKAGTGKTTLLKEIIRTTHKNVVVVAPTGIAALNAGGVTIHSMFQLPFGGFIPESNATAHVTDRVKIESKDTLRKHFRMSGQKKAVIQNMELLIIDEVSMLRADLLDAMDFMLQSVRKKRIPFGGVQVLFIGDLFQLPPVVNDEEWHTLRNYYKGKFFFHSHVVQQEPPLYIELSKIYRQTDDVFIRLLNNLRNNEITAKDIEILNQYVHPDFDLKSNKGYITLTTHNAKADAINATSLKELEGKEFRLKAEIIDDFPSKIFPVEEYLYLKEGCQIMFVKNDLSPEKNYFNGKMGFVQSVSEAEILVYFPEEDKLIEVEKYEWKNIRYTVNPMTKEIEEELLGTFVQYPVKLAWAITVHKSQGLTFDKAALDVSQVFLPGQAYVALSRLRSLNGLVLLSPIRMNGISNDSDVVGYANEKASEEILENALQIETRKFLYNYLKDSFEWSELIQEWRNHQFSYKEDLEKSEKAKHGSWAKNQSEAMQALDVPSRKFISQLKQLFSSDTLDLTHVSERINAAFNYFFPVVDNLVYEILWKIETVKRTKKAKAFYDELVILEALQVKAVIRLLKARKLLEIVVSGLDICKENLVSAAITNYKLEKTELVWEAFKKTNITLIENIGDADRYASKKKSKSSGEASTPKKATVTETHELWLQQHSVDEIATIRKLTHQTINSHMAKLVEAGKITLSELFPEDKIRQLAEAFKGYDGTSVNPLKEKYGNQFTWDELKIYKASLPN